MNNALKRKLSWRLEVLMAERKIRTATELHRLLVNSGYQITSSQLTRVIKDRPERISTDLLDHLLEILGCKIEELLRSDPVPEEDASAERDTASHAAAARTATTPQKQRVRREPAKYNPEDDLTGHKVTPFPIPPRNK